VNCTIPRGFTWPNEIASSKRPHQQKQKQWCGALHCRERSILIEVPLYLVKFDDVGVLQLPEKLDLSPQPNQRLRASHTQFTNALVPHEIHQQLKAQGPSRTCNESKEDEEEDNSQTETKPLLRMLPCMLDCSCKSAARQDDGISQSEGEAPSLRSIGGCFREGR